jgi:Ser-tRNA(Ala) deacylase AlaX
MEKSLYLFGISEHKVEVLACEPCENNCFKVILNQTPFHPQGGGQPSDVGRIAASEVLHVTYEEGNIIHLCKQAVALGQAYAKVDDAQRQLHSRLHSAGHLIGHLVETFGWQPVKAQHWPNDAKVQFVSTEKSEAVDPIQLECLLKQSIDEDLQTRMTITEDGFREIAFGDFAGYPCGGTHVQSLAGIGKITILKCEIKKGKLSVHYALATEHSA